MAGLLRDPEKGAVAQKPYIFFQKMRRFFLAQTYQASLGFGHKKNLPAPLKGFWSGWQDSNLRPPAPKAGAITGLRYTPKSVCKYSTNIELS